MIGIKYVKVRTTMRMIGINSSSIIVLDVILYKEICYFSKKQFFVFDDSTVCIIDEWNHFPENKSWENKNKEKIIRMLIIYK